jgi:hypothetical protein
MGGLILARDKRQVQGKRDFYPTAIKLSEVRK